jgi:FkbM family methyltransferase
MMKTLYLIGYRLRLLLNQYSAMRAVCRSDPARALVRQLKSVVRPTSERVWVRVQSGLSKGLWIRVYLPEEAEYWLGTHETLVQEVISALIQPGSVVFDVGAHVGSIALGAARLAGSSGHVIAFDGDPRNVLSLGRSCSRNRFDDRLKVIHAGIWSRSDREGIIFRCGNRHTSRGGIEDDGCKPVLADGGLIRVPAITLDEFIETRGLLPDLLKIDVEGGEYEVLRGASVLFRTKRPLIIVEIHHAAAAAQVAEWLSTYRYLAEWDVPKEGFPRTLFAQPAELTERVFQQRPVKVNVVAVDAMHGKSREFGTAASHRSRVGPQPF